MHLLNQSKGLHSFVSGIENASSHKNDDIKTSIVLRIPDYKMCKAHKDCINTEDKASAG